MDKTVYGLILLLKTVSWAPGLETSESPPSLRFGLLRSLLCEQDGWGPCLGVFSNRPRGSIDSNDLFFLVFPLGSVSSLEIVFFLKRPTLCPSNFPDTIKKAYTLSFEGGFILVCHKRDFFLVY